MEEREALKRQIELLQNLINNHNSSQTNAQQNVAPWSTSNGPSRAPSSVHRPGHLSNLTVRSQPYVTRPAGSWRKTYSLNNRSTAGRAKGPAAQPQKHTSSHVLTAPKTRTDPAKNTNSQTPISHTEKGDSTQILTKASVHSARNPFSSSKTPTSASNPHIKPQFHPSANPCIVDGAQSQPSSSSVISLHASLASASQPKIAPPSQPKEHSAKPATTPLKKSQYRWVKSQESSIKVPEPLQQATPSTTPPHPQPVLKGSSVTQASPKTATAQASSRTSPVSQQISSKRAPSPHTSQRSLISGGRPKISKYTWVSHSTLTTTAAAAKVTRKPLSPRLLQASPSLSVSDGARARKVRTKGGPNTVAASQTRLSRYRWRAEGATPTVVKGSVYRWTPQKERGLKGGTLSPSSIASPWGFKLRSRMKIIRRTPNRQMQAPVRTPPSSRRGNRALVSIGRHKLRLASPSRSAPASYLSGPAAHLAPSRVRTRYRIDARRWHGLPHPAHLNTARSWRTRRVQSARMLLQSRLRPQDRHWRGRRMRWIRGELYQVSANKLSRTQAPGTATNRTGRRWGLPVITSPSAASLNRTSSTRHVASRVVQRSLAIIRQAQQKKQQARQYCMYYNRFGKCNRGNACPYIHDPEKVAVCTRFLRGTCKQTNGTCPFSHRVSREKMPVCSYYLRGICNNSSCPYSHVYVSRKAAVCQDFLRGYCPQGEKCKKKHTLVCPDFSASGVCPRGTKCKLKHRLRKTAAASQAQNKTSPALPRPPPPPPPPPPAKRTHAKASSKRPDQGQSAGAESTPLENNEGGSLLCLSTPLSLPSFIALPSSPEDAIPPDTPPHALVPPTAKGEKLHIKPRF